MKEVKPHVHAELIKKWADDVSIEVWLWDKTLKQWDKELMPSWAEHLIYAVGEKPTSPPIRMVKYEGGTIEFPEPLKEPLSNGSPYFFADLGGIADSVYFYSQSRHYDRLALGITHLTKEGALKQYEALKELMQNHIRKWG